MGDVNYFIRPHQSKLPMNALGLLSSSGMTIVGYANGYYWHAWNAGQTLDETPGKYNYHSLSGNLTNKTFENKCIEADVTVEWDTALVTIVYSVGGVSASTETDAGVFTVVANNYNADSWLSNCNILPRKVFYDGWGMNGSPEFSVAYDTFRINAIALQTGYVKALPSSLNVSISVHAIFFK